MLDIIYYYSRVCVGCVCLQPISKQCLEVCLYSTNHNSREYLIPAQRRFIARRFATSSNATLVVLIRQTVTTPWHSKKRQCHMFVTTVLWPPNSSKVIVNRLEDTLYNTWWSYLPLVFGCVTARYIVDRSTVQNLSECVNQHSKEMTNLFSFSLPTLFQYVGSDTGRHFWACHINIY